MGRATAAQMAKTERRLWAALSWIVAPALADGGGAESLVGSSPPWCWSTRWSSATPRSAIGAPDRLAVHSAQTVVIGLAVLALVL